MNFIDVRLESVKNFVKARLNRDNFWNVMFWLGMTFGISIGVDSSAVLVCFTLVVMAFLITKLSPLKVVIQRPELILEFPDLSSFAIKKDLKAEKKELPTARECHANSEGKIVSDGAPSLISVLLNSLVIGFLLFMITAKVLPANTTAFVRFSSLFFVPVFIFVLYNRPISMLFDWRAWYLQGWQSLNPQHNSLIALPLRANLAGMFSAMPFSQKALVNFINSRRNSDNFWNVMFLVGSSILFSLSTLCTFPIDRFFFIILAIVGIPILVKIKSPVTFTEEKDFVNSKGEIITKRFPLGFLILLSIGGGAVLARHAAELSILLAPAVFLLFPVMLFILKNCPISMLFHSKVYTSGVISDMKLISGNAAYHLHLIREELELIRASKNSDHRS